MFLLHRDSYVPQSYCPLTVATEEGMVTPPAMAPDSPFIPQMFTEGLGLRIQWATEEAEALPCWSLQFSGKANIKQIIIATSVLIRCQEHSKCFM